MIIITRLNNNDIELQIINGNALYIYADIPNKIHEIISKIQKLKLNFSLSLLIILNITGMNLIDKNVAPTNPKTSATIIYQKYYNHCSFFIDTHIKLKFKRLNLAYFLNDFMDDKFIHNIFVRKLQLFNVGGKENIGYILLVLIV